jgi:toxin ParE1/3/4
LKSVLVSLRAAADLREIGRFIAADDPRRARSFVAELRARCNDLRQMPLRGRPAPEIAPDVRILVFRAYLILYRVQSDRFLIDRVLHGARERPPHE